MPKSGQVPEVTVAEAATLLQVDRKTVLRLIARGNLTPTRKLPTRTGAYLLPLDAVRDVAEKRGAA